VNTDVRLPRGGGGGGWNKNCVCNWLSLYDIPGGCNCSDYHMLPLVLV
jgi:hypothetical protein